MKLCRATWRPKRKYRDRIAALLALADIGQIDRASARERRAYPCPDCGYWHLTSRKRKRTGR